MPTWLIVALAVLGLFGLITLIFQLPVQNRFVDVAGDADPKKLVAWLDRGVDPNKPGWMGLTALGCAVMKNRTDNVRILLERGASATAPEGAASYLSAAIDGKDPVILEMLIQAGANPDQAGKIFNVPLWEAIHSCDRNAAQALIKAGANADLLDHDGRPLLASAIMKCLIKPEDDAPIGILQDLLAAGANPNRRTRENTPMVALALEHPAALRVLLDHGVITDVEWNGLELGPIIKSLTEDTTLGEPD